MSASKSSAKKQYSTYKIEQLGDIERLKNICFPKTPKTSQSNLSGTMSKQQQSQFQQSHSDHFFRGSVNVNDIVQNSLLNNSFNQSTQQQVQSQQHHHHHHHNQRRSSNNSLRRSQDESFQLLDFSNDNNRSLERKRKQQAVSQERTPTKKPRSYLGSRSHIKALAQQSLCLQARPSFEYPKGNVNAFSAVAAGLSFSSFSSVEDQSELLQQRGGGQKVIKAVQPGSAAVEMARFIRRIGCELNDLCLTKIPESSLSTMIEKHLAQVANVQKSFSDAMLEKEPNIKAGLEIISGCFDDLVEKLGDLVTRLRMFKKKKFQNLVEASLSSTLREVFEENNHLNLKQIVSDINGFVSNQRKSLYLWKLSSLIAIVGKRQKQHGFFRILEQARRDKVEDDKKSERVEAVLRKILARSSAHDRQIVHRKFFKWQYKKEARVDAVGRLLSGLTRLNTLIVAKEYTNYREGFKQITRLANYDQKMRNALEKLTDKISKHFRGCERVGFMQLKQRYYFAMMHWKPQLLRVKGTGLADALQSVVVARKQQAFGVLVQANQRREAQKNGLDKVVSLVDKVNHAMMKRLVTRFAATSRMNAAQRQLGSSMLFRLADGLHRRTMQSVFEYLRVELLHRKQPISEVFAAVMDEVSKLENPLLRNILRTVDACFSNKRITRHLANLRQIEFRMVNVTAKEAVSLNPIWKKLDWVSVDDEAIAVFVTDVVKKGVTAMDKIVFRSESIVASRDKCAVKTIVMPLDHITNASVCKQAVFDMTNSNRCTTIDLVCETSSAYPLAKQMEKKIVKLLKLMQNRLKESFYREKLHLKACAAIVSSYERYTVQEAFRHLREVTSGRMLLDQEFNRDEKSSSTKFEQQLVQYKSEIEKDRLNSSNIMRELGAKREEMHEIESRLEDLAIEKKFKSKCLATTLFANFIVSREQKEAKIRRGFTRWVQAIGEKRIASAACEQIEEVNAKHIESRLSSAVYLLNHFADSFQRGLRMDAMKALAYNSVVSVNNTNAGQLLNFSRSTTALNAAAATAAATGSMTPKRDLSPNASFLSKNKSSLKILDLSSNNAILNMSESANKIKQAANYPNLAQRKSVLNINENSNNHTELNSSSNNFKVQDLVGNNNQTTPTEHTYGFFGGSTQQHKRTSSQAATQNSAFTAEVTPANKNRNTQHTNTYQSQQQSLTAEQSRRGSVTHGNSGFQPPLQLQPTTIVDPVQSNYSPLLSASYNAGSQQYYQQSSNQKRNGSLNSSMMNQFYRGTHNTAEQENNASNYNPSLHSHRGSVGGLSRSMQHYGNQNSAGMSTPSSASKQPSNLGYRLSAKTINFLQKFGRGQQQQQDQFNEDPLQRSNHHTPSRNSGSSNNNNNTSYSMYNQQLQYSQQQSLSHSRNAQDGLLDEFDQVQTRRVPAYDEQQFYRRY